MYNYLNELEAESIYVLRETYARFKNPVILFSGGKDSIVLSYLARKAFAPLNLPIPLLHIDTGHNFPELMSFRDALVEKHQMKLLVGSVQKSIDKGTANEQKGLNPNRNVIQSVTLLEIIQDLDIDVAIGGARRDEEKARAKELFFSKRTKEGAWNPYEQQPEFFYHFNTLDSDKHHYRVFPLNNWNEIDIWRYIAQEQIDFPSLYFAHQRKVVLRSGVYLPQNQFISLLEGEQWEEKSVRFRTLGDMTITGAIPSEADTIDKIIEEISQLSISERGRRMDDQISDTAMEDRKLKGYF